MLRAFDPALRVAKEGLERQDRNILEQPLRLPIANRSGLAALRANRPAVAARLNINDQGFRAANQNYADET